jgi:hypothetical protein
MNTGVRIGAKPDCAANAATAARTRYREQAVNWIALGVLLGAWQMEAQLDRNNEPQPEPRLASPKPALACGPQPLWSAEPQCRSWIRRAKKSARTR